MGEFQVKKIAVIAVVAIGLAAFVGTDVIKSSVGSVRTAVRDALTSEVPLTNQLAEAQAQGYAEADPTLDVEGVDAAQPRGS